MSSTKPPQNIATFIEREVLPDSFVQIADQHYQPLAAWIVKQMIPDNTFLLGINGAQGSGKSTLAAYLKFYLAQEYNQQVAVLSIDDFYLTHEQRQKLGREVHPLLTSRGVPGTHDTTMLAKTLADLSTLKKESCLALPQFDKAQDDRAARECWPVISGPVDLVILEGWCVGSQAEPRTSLATAINTLEQTEDTAGRWRGYVNDQLLNQYQPIFNGLDKLIFLQVPDFESVYRWRLLQEEKLRRKNPKQAKGLMNENELSRFIEHFERLTRHNLATMPAIADVTLKLNADHQVMASIYK